MELGDAGLKIGAGGHVSHGECSRHQAALDQSTVGLLTREMIGNGGIIGGRHVGDTGNAMSGEQGAGRRERRRSAVERLAEPEILVEQPARTPLQPRRGGRFTQ